MMKNTSFEMFNMHSAPLHLFHIFISVFTASQRDLIKTLMCYLWSDDVMGLNSSFSNSKS